MQKMLHHRETLSDILCSIMRSIMDTRYLNDQVYVTNKKILYEKLQYS